MADRDVQADKENADMSQLVNLEAALETGASQEEPHYSEFTTRQKVIIVCLVSLAGFFSPFTAYVYFPALKSIATDFKVSIELINLTVTTYLIVQGLAPSILADTSEKIGRRPAYIISFTIYCAASLGLAFQRNYGALLVLRMLQSIGSSPAIALAFGVISDIAAPHERGLYVGASHIGFNSAPALGPIIGGLITEKVGWPWIFVFLAAFSGSCLLAITFFLRETSRQIVGNGSIPARGFNRPLYQYILHGKSPTHERTSRKSFVPNILPCLKLLFHKHTSLLLFGYSIFYMMYACVQATLSLSLERYYSLTPLQSGLCYLAYGVAGVTASYTCGLIADRDYRIVAEQHNFPIDRRKGDDIKDFPIEKARLRSIFIYIPLGSISVIGYGWTLAADTDLCVPIILQFIIGFTVAGIFNLSSTLMTDIHPETPVMAMAAANITRCLVAAGGVALIELIIDATGPGWAFTILGVLCWSTIPALLVLRANGLKWRNPAVEEAQDRVPDEQKQSTSD